MSIPVESFAFDPQRVAAFLAMNGASTAPSFERPVTSDMFAKNEDKAAPKSEASIDVRTAGTTADHVVDALAERLDNAVDGAGKLAGQAQSAGKLMGIGLVGLGAAAVNALTRDEEPKQESPSVSAPAVEEPKIEAPSAEQSAAQKMMAEVNAVRAAFAAHYETLAKSGMVEYVPESERAEALQNASLDQNDITLGANSKLPNQKANDGLAMTA